MNDEDIRPACMKALSEDISLIKWERENYEQELSHSHDQLVIPCEPAGWLQLGPKIFGVETN